MSALQRYSPTSGLTGSRNLYSPHFDEKEMFQHSAFAWDSSHWLELAGVTVQEEVLHHSSLACHSSEVALIMSLGEN